MDLKDKLHLVIYRVRERGLEIFVSHRDDEHYEFPEASEAEPFSALDRMDESIDLNSDTAPQHTRGLAIEGDYHDIPSLKKLLLEDARKLRSQLREMPNIEEGTFVVVKGMAKRLLPEQYRLVKELKEILVDRNSTKYM